MKRNAADDLDVGHGPIRPHGRIPTVVDSTFDWHRIVDGLQIREVPVTLAHGQEFAAIGTAKAKTGKRDALAMAKLLRAKLLRAEMIPGFCIYPSGDRPLLHLVRQRWSKVAMRADGYRRMRGPLYQGMDSA